MSTAWTYFKDTIVAIWDGSYAAYNAATTSAVIFWAVVLGVAIVL